MALLIGELSAKLTERLLFKVCSTEFVETGFKFFTICYKLKTQKEAVLMRQPLFFFDER